ncbi:SHOCT domain-containing protein [Halorussus salinus]|uniref:SHOCT domain-containing protein n=1 Tax=Halorussus salinus TaxID=1364935 RepID=UPI001091CD98|nr:SHOCT domain-containing protein [Halorussus salinus]
MTATPYERLRENATEVVSMLVTGIWLAAMFTGQDWWLAALLFGYVVVVPVAELLFGDEEDDGEWWDDEADEREADAETDERGDESDDDALETLRDRYARGELTDEQFERKLERLLDTETLEDVEDRARAREEQTEKSFDRSS